MVEFIVAAAGGSRAEFRFSVAGHMALVAGSRHLEVDRQTCGDLLEGLHLAGFHFFLGCARGVDKSFRRALAQCPFREEGFVACAFQSRALRERSLGLYAQLVVPEGLEPAAALRRRTLWMVKRCSLVVLIPENPFNEVWGPGSKLVFRSAMYHLKPVFVVSRKAPPQSVHYRVAESDLFGVVRGFWVVPHLLEEGGLCDDEC